MNEQITQPVLEIPKPIHVPPSPEVEQEEADRLRKNVVMPQLPKFKFPED